MMGSVIFTNLPALLVVVPLLLAPISALFTFCRFGLGGCNFLAQERLSFLRFCCNQ